MPIPGQNMNMKPHLDTTRNQGFLYVKPSQFKPMIGWLNRMWTCNDFRQWTNLLLPNGAYHAIPNNQALWTLDGFYSSLSCRSTWVYRINQLQIDL